MRFFCVLGWTRICRQLSILRSIYVPNALFHTWATFSVPAAGVSSRSQLRGTQGGRVYARRMFSLRLGPVARAWALKVARSGK